MNSDNGIYRQFFIFKDLDMRRTVIHLSPLSVPKNIMLEIQSPASSSLSTYIIQKGTEWTDLLYGGWPGLYVVNERVLTALQGATGIEFHPINVLDEKLSTIDVNYYRIQITGKSGPLIRELSKEEIATRISGGPKYVKRIGLFFTPDSWDGSDFFTPEGTLNIFTTAKIKELINVHSLTNIKMEHITEIEMF